MRNWRVTSWLVISKFIYNDTPLGCQKSQQKFILFLPETTCVVLIHDSPAIVNKLLVMETHINGKFLRRPHRRNESLEPISAKNRNLQFYFENEKTTNKPNGNTLTVSMASALVRSVVGSVWFWFWWEQTRVSSFRRFRCLAPSRGQTQTCARQGAEPGVWWRNKIDIAHYCWLLLPLWRWFQNGARIKRKKRNTRPDRKWANKI